jgi:hypothetical protein
MSCLYRLKEVEDENSAYCAFRGRYCVIDHEKMRRRRLWLRLRRFREEINIRESRL